MNLDVKFRRKEGVASRRIAGESFLIPVCGTPVDMENVFVLNPLADFIWQRLDGEHSLGAVVSEIMEEFDVAPGQAAADASGFVGLLKEHNLVGEEA
jgi:hypothetical protein